MTSRDVTAEHPVAPLELFFDLVFVFAFTQVTTLLTSDPTWRGLGHALILLMTLWWAWASYAWLTNTVDAQDGFITSAMLAAMTAMFVAALAVPNAFGSDGPVFGFAFIAASLLQGGLYLLAAGDDTELRAAIGRVVPWVFAGSALIVVAGYAGGNARDALWLAAIAIGFVGPGLVSVRGWRVHPAHFVERHGLIVIIAIGESLIAIGVGTRGEALSTGVIVGAVLGLVVAASLWLAYFDFFTARGRQLLDARSGEERLALARDIYTYAHLPMVAGIVLFAFATKVTLAHLHSHLGTIAAIGLCGGPALYLLGFVALRYRVSRTVGGGRPTAAAACIALIPLAMHVTALTALALVAAVWVVLHVYELVWWREQRAEARTPVKVTT